MSATLLELVQRASGEMGLSIPTVVVGSTNADTIQQLALINALGRELMREHQWQALNGQHIFTTDAQTLTGDTVDGSTTVSNITTATIDTNYQIAGEGINQACYVAEILGATSLRMSQPATANGTGVNFTLAEVKFAMPSDYDRQIDRTHWDKSKHWEMLGPETAQQWEWLISGYISTGPRVRYRIFGNRFQIWPMQNDEETLGFEYVSNAWAQDAGGTFQTSFAADTDTCIFPDSLMTLGLKKKYFEVKGFDTAAYDRDYFRELNIAKANDAGSPTLSMNPRQSGVLITWANVPDSVPTS